MAAVGAVPARRKARRRARVAHAGAVLQFPRSQVQREHDPAPAVGGNYPVVPALVRDAAELRRGARRAFRRGGYVRQVLVDLPAARARRCRAQRFSPRGVFPLAGAVGDHRSGCARARAACRVVDRERLCALLLRDGSARRGLARVHAGRLAGLPRGQRCLRRAAASHRVHHRAAEPRRGQGYGVAVLAASPQPRSGRCCWRRP